MLSRGPTLFPWHLLMIMALASGIIGLPKPPLPASYHPVSNCGKEAVSIAVVIETSTYLHSVSLRSPHLLTEKKSSLDRFLFEH